MAINKDKIESINKRSIYFQEVLDKVPAWLIRWGNMIFFAFYALILLSLNFIKYPDVVNTRVKVETENPAVIVRSNISEKIQYILKENQELVSKDDWVLILNSETDYKKVKKLDKVFDSLDLNSFWEVLDTIQLPDYTSLGSLRDPYTRFTRSIQEYSLFNKINNNNNQIAFNKKREKANKTISKQIQNQENITKKEVELLKINLDRSKRLFEKGVISKLELETNEIEFLNAKNELESIRNSKQNSLLASIGILKENISLTTEQSNRFFELRDNILNNYSNLSFSLEDWKNKYVLKAPISGILNFYDIRNSNQFLMSEKEAFIITPIDEQKYYAFLKMPTSNSGKVKVGQKVIIKLDNFPYTEFGVLSGHIINITKVPLEGNYLVQVDLPNQMKTSSNLVLDNKIELIGEAEIITNQRSLFSRIFDFFKNSNN